MEIKELQDPFSDDFPLDEYPTVYPENLSEKGKIVFDMMSLFAEYSGELSKLLGESTIKHLSSFLNGVIHESDEVNFDMIKNLIGTTALEIFRRLQSEYQKLRAKLNELSDKGIDTIDYEKFYRNKVTIYNLDKRSVSHSIIAFERYLAGAGVQKKQGQQYLDALAILYNNKTVLLDLMQSIETLLGQYDGKNHTGLLSIVRELSPHR